ncbi:RNA polymerase II-associated [Xylariomycetidae sp. FL0641]|nr:RNA polymerase II-associated [Xylariomycetidae sp. FL0641]
MASSSRSSEHRSVHQDFIARIRYSNALPPPPNPPKLLDIPNTGLESGQYTAPGFASRLAREQPLNIEADAELGMPLDLVGMPGIFDGDETSIQAPAQPPTVDQDDRPLLRPLQTLGKPKAVDSAVSFLRRTEYISSATSKAKPEPSIALRALNPTPLKRRQKRPSPEPDKDSPAYCKRKIDQGFAAAAANLKDKSRVKHPSKRHLKLVDAYPLLPDNDAFPDAGGYVTIKFLNNPVPPSRTYDKRLLSGVFYPADKTKAEEEAYEAALKAHEVDPDNHPKPPAFINYVYFLPESAEAAANFRARHDVDNPDHDNEALYSHRGGARPSFQFSRVRAYETVQEVDLDHESKYAQELLMSFSNGDAADGAQKAAYYYPVMQRSQLKPQRTKTIARTIGYVDPEAEAKVVDRLDVTVDAPDAALQAHLDFYREHPYEDPPEPEAEEQPQQQTEMAVEEHDEHEHAEHGEDGDGEERYHGSSKTADHDLMSDDGAERRGHAHEDEDEDVEMNGRAGDEEDDRDADGDEED